MSETIGQATKDIYAVAMKLGGEDKDKALEILAKEVAEWEDARATNDPEQTVDCHEDSCPFIESQCCSADRPCVHKRDADAFLKDRS